MEIGKKPAGAQIFNIQIKENVIIPKEQGGPKGPEPTRYGDWEKAGRCSDF